MRDVERQIERLAALTSADLRSEWLRLTGSPCPRISPALLRLALAWELQARVPGGLPRQPEFHTVHKAGHFDFLAPCADPTTMPQLCQSTPGFDRTAFHDRFDRELVRFFSNKLASGL